MAENSSPVQIRQPNSRRDYRNIVEMTAPIFRPQNPDIWLRNCDEGYFRGSSYDWAASRVAVVDGRIASHVGVWKLLLRVGRADILFGGIGAVATMPEYRGRGIASKIMRAVMQSMYDEGYAMSCMFGRRDFYGRHGYVPIYPRQSAVWQLESAIVPDTNLTAKPAKMTDLLNARGDIGRIYNSQRKLLSLTAERPVYTKNRYSGWSLHKFTSPAGKVTAYAATSQKDDELTVHETGGFATPAARRNLLGAIAKLAADASCKQVRFMIPPHHPLMTQLKRSDCKYEQGFHRDGWAMAAVVNLPLALKVMRTELACRLKNSAVSESDFSMKLACGDQSAAIIYKAGKLSVRKAADNCDYHLTGGDMARLLVGSDRAGEIIEAGQMKCSPPARQLAEILWPPTDPQIPDPEMH